jgi:DNA polymerase III subunit delta
MPPAATKSAPFILVHGDDELGVQQRARALFQQWSAELGGMDHETIEATASNAGAALQAIGKLREALQTLPFFGSGKAIWFKDCNFLADDRTSASAAVTEALVELAQELKAFPWDKVRLVLSAGKVDKRKTFYKTAEKIGSVEVCAGWSSDDREWTGKSELAATTLLRERKKEAEEEALALLVTFVGPNPRLLASEVEKLCLFVGDRARIESRDVEAVVTRQKQARAFALGDALGDRNLPAALKCLDEELWEMQFDKQRSEIGLLYGLISKVRAMLFAKELLRLGWVKSTTEYYRFKSALEGVPADKLPKTRQFNPLALNPFVLFRAAQQCARYSQAELARAMDLLLECNLRLVSSQIDEALLLQQTLVRIIGGAPPALAGSAARR